MWDISMSWLSKVSQFKPFPLPADAPWDDKNFGAFRVDELMSEDTASSESVMHPDLSFLGQGNIGVAYRSDGYVIKYTSDVQEYRAGVFLVNNPTPCTVRVYGCDEVQSNPGVWKLVLEEVTPIDDVDKNDVNSIHDFWSVYDDFPDDYSLVATNKKLYYDYVWLIQCLTENGLDAWDAHGGNVGYNSKGRLVLLDVGKTIS